VNHLRQALERALRGPRATHFLEAMGIDPKRYWLLMDLFSKLSERAEVMDQLGRNSAALKYGVIFYFLFSSFMGLVMAMSDMPPYAFLGLFLVITFFLLSSLLISEAGNSLVNPTEAMVLAHQPIDGATYSAAKLSHLLRIVFYLVPGLNLAPAFEGLFLTRARWYYPLLHLSAALVVGLVTALACCAVIGWLIRIVPVRRLKAAAQLAGTVPFLMMMLQSQAQSAMRTTAARQLWTLLSRPAVLWPTAIAGSVLALTAIGFGLRALTADFLIRATSLVKGSAKSAAHSRPSIFGSFTTVICGGQAGRAGFAFVSRMVRRDYQFRRQMIPTLIFPLISLAPAFKAGMPPDPFIQTFTFIHLLPHVMGLVLFFGCFMLRFGNDYKGGWVFLLAPSRAIEGLARGVHAYLWLFVVLIPAFLVVPVFAWRWGLWHALLFAIWSIAAGSMYLAVELLLIESIPFTQQMNSGAQSFTLMLMMVWGLAAGAAVALQYFVIFRSTALTMGVSVALGAAAYFVTTASLRSLATSMRYHLNMTSQSVGNLYQEIAA